MKVRWIFKLFVGKERFPTALWKDELDIADDLGGQLASWAGHYNKSRSKAESPKPTNTQVPLEESPPNVIHKQHNSDCRLTQFLSRWVLGTARSNARSHSKVH